MKELVLSNGGVLLVGGDEVAALAQMSSLHPDNPPETLVYLKQGATISVRGTVAEVRESLGLAEEPSKPFQHFVRHDA